MRSGVGSREMAPKKYSFASALTIESAYAKGEALQGKSASLSETSQLGKRQCMAASSKPHVVLAEDEVLLSSLMREVLEEEGYRVTVAENGKEALEADNADPADILLTDLRMPVLDGNTLIQLVRLRRPALPIVVVTGYDVRVPEWEENRLAMLRKPFDHGALLRTMQALLATDRI